MGVHSAFVKFGNIAVAKQILLRFGRSNSLKAFLWLILGAFGTALAVFYRNYVIYSQYDEPPELLFFPLLFEYAAFSLVAFLFPWSFYKIKKPRYLKIIIIVATGLFFVLAYVFLLNFIEWYARGRTYDFWLSFRFTALHSSFYTAVIYSIISLLLYALDRRTHNTKTDPQYLQRLAYRDKNETHYIQTERAFYIEADGNYISMYGAGGERFLIRKSLQQLETQLDPAQFQRIHRKHMVNLDKIASYKVDPNGGYRLLLKNDQELKVSRTYIKRLRPLLKGI